MEIMKIDQPRKIESHPLKQTEIPIPMIGPKDILIKIRTCGVCHTDLHVVEGDLPMTTYPRIPGHEIIGIVKDIGPKVTMHTIGSRVGVAWLNSSCSNCKYCKTGKENLCSSAIFTGCTADGGFAEYIAVNEAYAYQIPSLYSDLHAAPLLCAGIIGYRSYKLSDIQPGQRLGLFGFGASAHIVLQIAQAMDCETYVFTRSPNHQSHARELGATWVGNPNQQPPKMLDSAITFAPVGEIVLRALNCVDKGGTLAINAVHLTDIPSFSYDQIYYERTLRSVAHTTREDAIEFLKFAEKTHILTEVNEYSLFEANEALEDLKYSRFSGAAVLRISK
ncbi:MAG: zinc-dependent alcohol dehydrogenase family protein [Candidatus Lokiarchaeota archaeon]|nr:zinc-dependent alcohol dehydrogenase family protein [Candidatus Harpocratesius repetitus]